MIEQHTTVIAKQLMCGGSDDIAVLVVDSTYIYIQVRKTNLSLSLLSPEHVSSKLLEIWQQRIPKKII